MYLLYYLFMKHFFAQSINALSSMVMPSTSKTNKQQNPKDLPGTSANLMFKIMKMASIQQVWFLGKEIF